MKSAIKAESLAALDKPPVTWEVTDEEITFHQQRRSSKPELGYSLADKVKHKFEKLTHSANKSSSKDNAITTQPSSPYPSPALLASAPPPPFTLDDTLPQKDISPETSDDQIIYVKKSPHKGQPTVTYVESSETHTPQSLVSDSPVITTAVGPVLSPPNPLVTQHLLAPIVQPVSPPVIPPVVSPYVPPIIPPLPPPPQVDSDDDNTMADDKSLLPKQFHGTGLEDAEQWMRQFENYCTFKTYNDDKKLALCRVLLVEGAANWLETLADAAVANWGAFKDNFLTRYSTPEYMHFKSARTIMNTKMEQGQSVDDYVAKMQQLARSIKADEKMVKFAIMNGLLPHISSFVAQKQPADMTALLEAARIAEATAPIASDSNTTIVNRLDRLQDQFTQLLATKDQPNVLNVKGESQSRGGTPPRSQSPRRVRFEDWQEMQYDQPTYTSYPQRGYPQRGRFPRRGNRGRGFGRGFGRPQSAYERRYNTYGGYANPQTEMQEFYQQSAYGMRPMFSQNGPPGMNRQFPYQSCFKCGGRQHENLNACPAINQNCRYCARVGHFARVCRTRRRANTFE